MATVVRLQVHGIDFSDDQRIDGIEEAVPEVSFSLSNGVVIAEIVLGEDSENLYHKATDILHILRTRDTLIVDRVEPLLVNTSDIAQLVGVTRQAVTKWVANPDSTFPKEEACIGRGERRQKIWNLYEVNTWLAEVAKIDLQLELPAPELVREIDAFLVEKHEPVSEEWASFTGAGASVMFEESVWEQRSAGGAPSPGEWGEIYWGSSFSSKRTVVRKSERDRRAEVNRKGSGL